MNTANCLFSLLMPICHYAVWKFLSTFNRSFYWKSNIEKLAARYVWRDIHSSWVSINSTEKSLSNTGLTTASMHVWILNLYVPCTMQVKSEYFDSVSMHLLFESISLHWTVISTDFWSKMSPDFWADSKNWFSFKHFRII